MKASRKLNRRSFVASVAGGALIGGGATSFVLGRAEAQNTRYSGVTDSDTGQHADRPGYGTGTRSQYTDQDRGPNADAQFHGRGPTGTQGGVSGTGRYDGPVSGCSDNDHGSGSDPGGHGRTCGQRPFPRSNVPTHTRHCTDSDNGANHDPVEGGRRC